MENNWLRRRVLEKKNPSRPHICWGSLFCTNLTQPTGNLDSKTSGDVIKLLRTVNQRFEQTLIMITHNLEIAQLSDRIINIIDGKVDI